MDMTIYAAGAQMVALSSCVAITKGGATATMLFASIASDEIVLEMRSLHQRTSRLAHNGDGDVLFARPISFTE